MKFRVIWTPGAEQALAALWLDPVHRSAVTRAANEIDSQLEADAPSLGESRPDGLRILIESPLGVTYEIDPDGQTVYVLHVWKFRQGRRQP